MSSRYGSINTGSVGGSLVGGGSSIIGDSGGRLAFLRIGRGSFIVSGGQSRSGGGGSPLCGVLQRRCGLVGLAGVDGGFLAGRGWHDTIPH